MRTINLKSSRVALIGILAFCLTLTGAGAGFASGGSSENSAPSTPGITTGSTETAANLTQEERDTVRQIRNLKIGKSALLQGSKDVVFVTKTTNGYSVSESSSSTGGNSNVTPASFCGVSLATLIVGMGAGALTVLAAVTGGGTAVLFGVVLTGAQIGVLAGIATSYTAVLGWVSANIC